MNTLARVDKRRPAGRLDVAPARIDPFDLGGAGPQAPGGFSVGTTVYGGPVWSDAFQSRHSPSPSQLIEKFKSLIYMCAIRNANAVSRIPLRLYADGSRAKGKPRSDSEPIKVGRHIGMRLARSDSRISAAAVDQIYEIRNHPLLDVLDNPDPYDNFTRRQLIALMVAYMDVVGGGFLVPEGRGWDWRNPDPGRKKGPPEFLWVTYAQFMIPFREAGSTQVRYWSYFRDKIGYQDSLWFRHALSLRDAYGSSYSPTVAGDVYADQEDRFCAVWDQVLALGPRPNVVASAKDPNMPPGESERERLKQDFNRSQAAGNAGGLWVSTGAFDFTPISYQPADLAAKEINEYNLHRIASLFGQPPTYYSVDTNVANLQAADEQHARNAVEPRCDVIAGKLTQMARKMDPRLTFKFDPAIQEDDEARARVIDMKIKSGLITINQANEEERYPAVPWGDEPWLPGTLAQPSLAMERHQQGIEQQKAGIESQKKRDDFELVEESPDDGDADTAKRGLDEVQDMGQRMTWLKEQIQRRLSA